MKTIRIISTLAGVAVLAAVLFYSRAPGPSEVAMRLAGGTPSTAMGRYWNEVRKTLGKDQLSVRLDVESQFMRMGVAGEEAIPVLRSLLGDPEACPYAARCLAYTGQQGITNLMAFLNCAANTNRSAVLFALGNIGTKIAILGSLYFAVTNWTVGEKSLALQVSFWHLRKDQERQREILRHALASPMMEVRCRALEIVIDQAHADPQLSSVVEALVGETNVIVSGLAWRAIREANWSKP